MLRLERFCYSDQGTFGTLLMPGHRWYTVELPWRHNERYVSCIPEDTYPLLSTHYTKGDYWTFAVWDVPQRDGILIHLGNTIDDLLGCIALGQALGVVNEKWAVQHSQLAFNDFMLAMKGTERTEITITHREGDGHVAVFRPQAVPPV